MEAARPDRCCEVYASTAILASAAALAAYSSARGPQGSEASAQQAWHPPRLRRGHHPDGLFPDVADSTKSALGISTIRQRSRKDFQRARAVLAEMRNIVASGDGPEREEKRSRQALVVTAKERVVHGDTLAQLPYARAKGIKNARKVVS